MDNLSIAGLSSITTLLITSAVYICYRLCFHFHLKSKCCGRTSEIDWTTQTPPDADKKKTFIIDKKSEV